MSDATVIGNWFLMPSQVWWLYHVEMKYGKDHWQWYQQVAPIIRSLKFVKKMEMLQLLPHEKVGWLAKWSSSGNYIDSHISRVKILKQLPNTHTHTGILQICTVCNLLQSMKPEKCRLMQQVQFQPWNGQVPPATKGLVKWVDLGPKGPPRTPTPAHFYSTAPTKASSFPPAGRTPSLIKQDLVFRISKMKTSV